MVEDKVKIISDIKESKTSLGIEFGSTRIKAVLVGENFTPIAQGAYEWENHLENGIWTYPLDEITQGLQACYADLKKNVADLYGEELQNVGSIGISAMMHGYMAFDKDGELLVPFRTWRNTITQEASEKLTKLFNYNIPQRWSIAHLYQAMLKKEEHLSKLAYITTLAGYIHWRLTGEKVIGVGDASGMFPIDTEKGCYFESMAKQFDELISKDGYSWRFGDVMPKILMAGENAGKLTEEGAKLLDVSGKLKAGAPLCPPEGDAGTGMVATNSVAVKTGNVSAGTSVFAMVVLENNLSKVYPEIDLVTTPSGDLVGMAHCNNCTSDLNAWVSLFDEFCSLMGVKADKGELFGKLYNNALTGDADCGGLLSYCYLSGEPITGFDEGRPMFARTPDSKFTLANFMRTHLYSSLATLKIGMDLMLKEEGVKLERMTGHGGFFKTKGVGQKIMSAAVSAPVSVMQTAGEGGAWGIALLAAYLTQKGADETLGDFLTNKVFADSVSVSEEASEKDVEGFSRFMERYKAGLAAEKAAVESIALIGGK